MDMLNLSHFYSDTTAPDLVRLLISKVQIILWKFNRKNIENQYEEQVREREKTFTTLRFININI